MSPRFLATALLAGTCLAFTGPAASAATFSGYGEMSGGLGVFSNSWSYHEIDYSEEGDTVTNNHGHWGPLSTEISGLARGNINFEGGVGLQLDIEGQNFAVTNDSISTSGIGAHLYKRGGDWLLGGLFSVGQAEWGRAATFGLEGQWLFPRTTLYGQLTYSRFIEGTMARNDENTINLSLAARHFITDHLVVSGTVDSSFGGGGYDDGGSDGYFNWHHETLLQWEFRSEYLLESIPLSLFASYRGTYGVLPYHRGYPPAAEDWQEWGRSIGRQHIFMVGLRYYFGQDTLLANDRNGATLDDRNPWYGSGSHLMNLEDAGD